MTVKELIDKLAILPANTPVVIIQTTCDFREMVWREKYSEFDNVEIVKGRRTDTEVEYEIGDDDMNLILLT